MTQEWKSSTDKRLFLLRNMPDAIGSTLSKAWQQHYEELYEPEQEGAASLQDALDEILELFQGHNQTLSHLRYVWMALILVLVVEPTVKYYQPNSLIPAETIKHIVFWLLETLEQVLDSEKQFAQVATEKETNVIIDVFRLFTEKKEIVSFQVLSEALDAYSSAIKTLDYNQSVEALLDILDNCLEGYAIFPGSYGRRELFDWWLLEVVPASWYLFPPSSIYSVDKLANENRIAFRHMDTLKKISSAMWSIIRKKFQRRESLSGHFRNTFDYANKIELNVKFWEGKFSQNKIFSVYESI